jgi:hypothetical protein
MESIFWASGPKASCADAALEIMAMTIAKDGLHIHAPLSFNNPRTQT